MRLLHWAREALMSIQISETPRPNSQAAAVVPEACLVVSYTFGTVSDFKL